jgi:enterochelin esterase-like enzyme
MLKRLAIVLFLLASVCSAESMSAPQLIQLANSNGAGLSQAIQDTFKAEDLAKGTGWVSHGKDFFFAVRAATEPSLVIDDASPAQMKQISGTDIWYAVAAIEPIAHAHVFHYVVKGERFGGSTDVPAFGPISYTQDGVPEGKLSDKLTLTSRIYDGMKSNYWIYVPAQYDPKIPAALMVFQDGNGYIGRKPGAASILNVIDNLIAQHRIPVMICVFIDPGVIGDSPGTPTYNFVKAYSEKWGRTMDDSMRSTLYDTVSDRYARYLRDEVLADVGARYNLRKDAYSRGITGLSSGGICSFNVAWQMPDQFSRVITWIGSFTSIQWQENPANPDGGQDYPDKVLRGPARNIRVWMQDGSGDLELEKYGSWPMANIRMANALKLKGYDFHFSFGKGTHNRAQGSAEFPESMLWLWRDYDPARNSQQYEMEAAEKGRPLFRVSIVSR